MTKFYFKKLKSYQRKILNEVITTSFPELSKCFGANNLTIKSKISKKTFFEISKTIKSICNAPLQNKNEKKVTSYHFHKSDPLHYLQRKNEIIWIGQGLPIYTGTFLKIKKILQQEFEKIALNKLNCLDVETPALWTKNIFEKTNYLTDFPQEAIFCIAANKNSQSLSHISNTANFLNSKLESKHLSIIGGLQPSVCTVCYAIASTLSNKSNKVLTTFNKVFRNEGEFSLKRIKSFSVRDLITIGTQVFVEKKMRQFEFETTKYLKTLSLEFTIDPANDPFFMRSSNKIAFQNIYNLKREINFNITKKTKFALGSINNHLTTFGAAFSIKQNSHESPAFSGCLGIGFDRLTYAMFYQFGQKISQWPKIIKNKI